MRTNTLLIEKEVGKARVGWLTDLKNPIDGIELNQLTPYVSKPEDLEVVVRNNSLLKKSQPLEINGFYTKQLLGRALSLQGELIEPYIPYPKFAAEHNLLMSFPSEVIWLSKGLDKFKDNMVWGLQKGGFGLDKEKAEKISSLYTELIAANPENYTFWESIVNQKFESEVLSRILIDWTIENALLAKSKYLSGLIPVIDSKTVGSITLAHRMNIAYANTIKDRLDHGQSSPKYFYTITLNSSIIERDNWSENLQLIIRNVKQAMDLNLFDGIHVSIRGLSRISNDSGKVATTFKLINELNTVANEGLVPIWWSRCGIIGLGILDAGASFASFSLNMGIEDIFSDFGNKNADKLSQYGKVLNSHMKQLQDVRQITKLREGLPEIDGVFNKPSELELESATAYRKNFAKPYNLAVMKHLNKQWLDYIQEGDTNPGREYLQTFDSPRYYSSWGLN